MRKTPAVAVVPHQADRSLWRHKSLASPKRGAPA